MDKNDIVMVSAVRTPFGRYGGSLKDFDYFDLGAIPMREVNFCFTGLHLRWPPGLVFRMIGDTLISHYPRGSTSFLSTKYRPF